MSKGQPNNTESNNTEYSNTNPILSVVDKDADKEERDSYMQYFYDRLDMEILLERYPYDKEVVEAIFNLVLDVVCSKRKTIRIAGDDKPVAGKVSVYENSFGACGVCIGLFEKLFIEGSQYKAVYISDAL